MDLLARFRGRVVGPTPGSQPGSQPDDGPLRPCPRCGEPDDRIVDPAGTWYVCTRCGNRTEVGEGR